MGEIMEIDKKIFKLMLNYYVIFKSSTIEEDYEPIIKMNKNNFKDINSDSMHLFDKDLVKVLSAFEYILHLPRIGLDFYDLDEGYLFNSHDEPVNIIPIPSNMVEQIIKIPPNSIRPTLIVYEDECEKEAHKLEDYIKPVLNSCKLSELNSSLLKNHWEQLYEYVKAPESHKCKNVDVQFLLQSDMTNVLPLLFYARQLSNINNVFDKVFNTNDIFKICYQLQLEQLVRINTLKELHNRNIHEIERAKLVYDEVYEEELVQTELNVVITFPGIPRRQKRYGGLATDLPEHEKRAIRIMGLHRAIANNGIYIELPCASDEIFNTYNELEINCKNGTNNKYVWKSLMDLGKLMSKYFNRTQVDAIRRAKHLTIFSDLPIGLSILEGTNVPLCCYKSISYRPLTPLTRNMQLELPKQSQYYLGKRCNLIIAECIKPKDRIRKHADIMSKLIIQMQNQYKNFSVTYQETLTIKELECFIMSHKEADILLISAHGYYDRISNMAGLMVGDEQWMANTNKLIVPPVVLLSACHVSPRGSGVVSVADMFMRLGAMTVLGTFIPVNVNRNTLLMIRLFVYILETICGSKQFKTLDEVWKFVVSSNAINEIIESSMSLKVWFMSVNSNGKRRIEDFELERSVSRLKYINIYDDTIEILKEMLKEDGKEGKFKNILDEKDFFPESLFYQFIGYPENIFLYNEVFEKAYNQDML